MRTQTLFLGSAAALLAATGARAADAVVLPPAPEPAEYVRVCDVYGAGFYYIPGTETCLKISGFVFYQIGATSDDGGADETANYHGMPADEYEKYIRTRIDFDARSETEWGTLRGLIRVQTDYKNGAPDEFGTVGNDPNLGLDAAWLSLGGFRAGYADSAWKNTPNGGPSGQGTHSWSGLDYGSIQRQFVQYNFSAGSGFFGTISLEEDPSNGVGDANYIPDIVGKIGVTQGWGTLWAQVAVDETSEDTGVKNSTAGALATGDTEWVGSVGAHINIGEADSLRVIGYYASDPNAYWNYGKWSVLGSYWHQFTPDFGASLGGQYIADTNYYLPDDPNLWLAELNLVWTPVTDFEVRSEITYAKASELDGSVSGFLRFTRYFGG